MQHPPPPQQTRISLAVALFGRPIRGHLPLADLHLQKEWKEIAEKREEALTKPHVIRNADELRTKHIPPLNFGDPVQIQNQTGIRPTKWNNTGFVTEVLPHRQYRVVLDGSRRVILRNRRFLKKILPVCCQIEECSFELLVTNQPAPLTTTEGYNPKTLAPARPVSTTEPKVAAPTLDDHPISITQPKPPSHNEQLSQGGVPPVKDTLHGHCHQSLQDSRMIEYNEHMYIDGH